eukprot:TRINITY_DN4570_c0_g2_i4.p1 TRINITY_DN4570_c0_g2~~TRINITY_DN4570_c0_g2_i4.p1  ORF type:complete len:726 (+),score=102.28 TRINITY_DN4570_c0_g2_i4:73-2250(+)
MDMELPEPVSLQEFVWKKAELPLRYFHLVLFLGNTMFGMQTTLPGPVVIATNVALTAMGLAAALCIKNYRHASNLTFVVLLLAVALSHIHVFFVPDEIPRQRGSAIITILWKQFPSVFGLLRFPAFLILAWSTLLDGVSLYCMAVYYGDDIGYGKGLNVFSWFLIYFFVSCMQLSWVALIHVAKQDLLTEKAAMTKMLSTLCDCHIYLHEDGDMVLRSHPCFDGMVGEAMESKKLSETLGMCADEMTRLQDGCTRARKEPVVLSTSMGRKSEDLETVDLVIVKRDSITNTKKECSSSFLVGIRIGDSTSKRRVPPETPSADDKKDDIKIDNLKDPSWENFDQFSSHDDDDDASAGGETTLTGRQFDALAAALRAGNNNVAKSCIQRICILGQAEKWLVPPSDIQLFPKKVLGSGGFGTVVHGAMFGADVAVKVVAANGSRLKKQLPTLLNEMRIIRRLHHPHVVQFHGACLDVESMDVCLIFELVLGVVLGRFVQGEPKSKKDAGERCYLLSDVASALRYLHAQIPPIVHGDLKSSNVMVENRGWGEQRRPWAKLLDFGLSRLVTPHASATGGTPGWMAPEVLSNRQIVLKPNTDVFSFGRMMFFCVTGVRPHENVSRDEIRYQVHLGVSAAVSWPAGDNFFPDSTPELVESCLALSPASRPSMEEVHISTMAWKVHFFEDMDDAYEEVTCQAGLKQVRKQRENEDHSVRTPMTPRQTSPRSMAL